jgi:subtilisin family serine protease
VTDEFVCQFKAHVSRHDQEELHRRFGVTTVMALAFAPSAWVLRVRSGDNPVETANRYYETGLVEFAHADFIKPRVGKHARPARPRSLLGREWHLKNVGQSGGMAGADADVVAAWRLTRGLGSVVLAVIDDGFDTGHGDFAPARRLVGPLDVRTGSPDPTPRSPFENHGTAVLGVAAAGGRGSGVLGVAPDVSLMPIRLDGGERHEAQAIAAAAASADVVNCSWGPPDGDWWNPDDPRHQRLVPLPDVVAAAMRHAVRDGRGGLGTVLVWAAGNGNESISNDGYASAAEVIAVAASNHDDRRSVYSDHGPEVALCAPSSDLDRERGIVGGIYASDRRGRLGYNPSGNYTDRFGGTSAAAPVVAGVIALMLSVHPRLDAGEVRQILAASAERIDPASPTWRQRDGRWHSDHYGAGRVAAARAVAAAEERAEARPLLVAKRLRTAAGRR